MRELKALKPPLVFSSGYTANTSIIPVLAGEDDLILSDALNHASIIDGCRLSRATKKVYRHCDVEHLKTLLSASSAFRRRLIVTDGVFSMDGDIAPLPDICELAAQHDAMVLVDDAHGFGVLGKKRKRHHLTFRSGRGRDYPDRHAQQGGWGTWRVYRRKSCID